MYDLNAQVRLKVIKQKKSSRKTKKNLTHLNRAFALSLLLVDGVVAGVADVVCMPKLL